MALHATVARAARGRLMGGDAGKTLASEAAAWLTRQGVRDTRRFVAMLAPGLG